jgi:DNA-binding transcriptional regulator YdaS (Cro superfamily)
MDLSSYLKQTRETQTEFASRIGAHPISVNRWCNKRALPSAHWRQVIFDATDGKVRPSDLLGDMPGALKEAV